jgi:hypothetical protein
MNRLSRLGRTATAVMAALALAGCAAALDPNGTRQTVRGMFNQDASDRAMSALTRADYSAAERHALTALRYNARDPVALLVAGMAYQGTGRYDLARQYYEVIITNQLPGTITAPGDGGVAMPRSVVEVARANTAVIDKITGRQVARNAAQSGSMPGPSLIGAPPFPVVDRGPAAMPGRPTVAASPLEPMNGVSASVTAPVASEAETNVAGRFRILKRLLDEGLLTQEEFSRRRAANQGALLPFSVSPPSVGLERPIPGDEAVVRRLREIGQTLETRATSPAQHAAERSTILDALLPDKPRKLEAPPLAPKDMIEAGQAVGRLERLRAAGLVGADEAKRERDAIERALDNQLGTQRVAGTATGLKAGAPGGTSALAAANGKVAGAWGVRLASLKTEDAARTSWNSIKAKFPEDLKAFDASFKKVTQGEKGQRWQVIAGPVADKAAAQKLCKTLKLHRQACDPATM